MCIILNKIHIYIKMHILQHEIIFIDLTLTQMTALNTTIAHYFSDHTNNHKHTHIELNHTTLISFTFATLNTFIFTLTKRARKYVSQKTIVNIVYTISTTIMIILLNKTPNNNEDIKHIFNNILLLTE